jgi:hypothetical protein
LLNPSLSAIFSRYFKPIKAIVVALRIRILLISVYMLIQTPLLYYEWSFLILKIGRDPFKALKCRKDTIEYRGYRMPRKKYKKTKGKVLRNIARLVKGEPINMDERMEKLEEEVNSKIKQMEESLSLFREVVFKLHNENVDLKKRNESLMHFAARARQTGNKISDKVVKPVMNEGKEFATLMLEDGGHSHGDDADAIVVKEDPVGMESVKQLETPAKIVVKSEPEIVKDNTNPAEIDLRPDLRTNESKEKTVRWMRERFGLNSTIAVKKFGSKKKYSRIRGAAMSKKLR